MAHSPSPLCLSFSIGRVPPYLSMGSTGPRHFLRRSIFSTIFLSSSAHIRRQEISVDHSAAGRQCNLFHGANSDPLPALRCMREEEASRDVDTASMNGGNINDSVAVPCTIVPSSSPRAGRDCTTKPIPTHDTTRVRVPHLHQRAHDHHRVTTVDCAKSNSAGA